jgi:hypothetical protein
LKPSGKVEPANTAIPIKKATLQRASIGRESAPHAKSLTEVAQRVEGYVCDDHDQKYAYGVSVGDHGPDNNQGGPQPGQQRRS